MRNFWWIPYDSRVSCWEISRELSISGSTNKDKNVLKSLWDFSGNVGESKCLVYISNSTASIYGIAHNNVSTERKGKMFASQV